MKLNHIAGIAIILSSLGIPTVVLADEPSQPSVSSTASASKTTHVEIFTDDRVWAPSQFSISYRSKCLDFTYDLRIDSVEKNVNFSISSNDTNVVDITSSEFGKTMLNRKYYGRVVIACDKAYAHVLFTGYDNSSGKPLPISETILIKNDGTIAGDTGLTFEKDGFVELQPMM